MDAREDFAGAVLPYLRQLYAAALRLTGNHADAEDLVQETCANAFAGYRGFTQGTNLRAWLHRIQLNAYRSRYRARRVRPSEVPVSSVEIAAPEGAATSRSAEEVALERMPDTVIRQALRRLPPHQRASVYLADVEGWSYAEIAQVMGVPLGTVMSRLHRGRGRLRTSLAGYARDEFGLKKAG